MSQLQGDHTLKLGRSFTHPDDVGYVTFRYDFKPASIDPTQDGQVETGKGQDVTVTLPHIAGSAASHTVFRGNKRPTQKECVLIVNKKTGEVSLERVSAAVQLKKTRAEVKRSQPSVKSTKMTTPPPATVSSTSTRGGIIEQNSDSIHDSSSAGSSPSASSDEDDNGEATAAKVPRDSFSQSSSSHVRHILLKEDLRLSESGSDSD